MFVMNVYIIFTSHSMVYGSSWLRYSYKKSVIQAYYDYNYIFTACQD